MKTKRLGCMNVTGLYAAVIILIVVLAVEFIQGGVLFSPGKLSTQTDGQMLGGARSHADLNGRCGSCHPPFWSAATMADLCQKCHTDLFSDPQAFHSVMLAEGKLNGCRGCHPDHNGSQAALIQMDLQDFPHNQMGFSLEGHQKTADGQQFACSGCHTASYKDFDLQVCSNCHTQIAAAFISVHKAAYGSNCLDCHDGVDRFGKNFTHAQFAFVLDGKHSAVACSECHSGAQMVADFKSAPQNCMDCHSQDDPHQGRFGQECSRCHSTDGWQDASFEHSLASFQLEGKHQEVSCDQCHLLDTSGKPVFKGTPTTCYGCHASQDHHQGQFGKECEACHNPSGWIPATFDHSNSSFPLTGAHLGLACSSCHTTGTGGMIFAGTPTTCVGCHQEPGYHQGLFGKDCAACHTTNSWVPAKYNGSHAFPMSHGGASTCQNCHPSSLNTYTCYTCHDKAEMAAQHREEGIKNLPNCLSCHRNGEKND